MLHPHLRYLCIFIVHSIGCRRQSIYQEYYSSYVLISWWLNQRVYKERRTCEKYQSTHKLLLFASSALLVSGLVLAHTKYYTLQNIIFRTSSLLVTGLASTSTFFSNRIQESPILIQQIQICTRLKKFLTKKWFASESVPCSAAHKFAIDVSVYLSHVLHSW